MNTHLDALETRAPSEREAALLAALPAQIAHAQKMRSHWQKLCKASTPPTLPAALHWPSCQWSANMNC
jgi:phenylacetate-CoA ligase